MGAVWILSILLTAGFTGVTLASTRSTFSIGDLAALVALFGLLALALSASARVAAAAGRVGVVLAALCIGALWTLHLRQQAMRLYDPLAFAGTIALVALPCAVLIQRSRAGSVRLALAIALVAWPALLGATVLAYRSSDTQRWHLLHHARLLGVPTYLALGPPVGPVLDALWAQGRSKPPVFPHFDPRPGRASPDLVLILVDTLRADSLAAYGGDPALMPHLNELADESLVLESLSANATYTKSSVASMFTGLLPEEHGAVDHTDRLPAARDTLAEVMRRRGYETAAFVSNYLNVGKESGFDQGFEHFAELKVPGQPYARAGDVNAAVRAWLVRRGQRDATRPLFLYLHYLDPHTPYLSGWEDPGRRPDAMRRGYDAELRYVDEQLFRMIEELKRSIGPETVFVLVADHGEEFGEHGSTGHGHTLYRELVHVPCLVYRQGGPRGRLATRIEGRDVFGLVVTLSREGPGTLDRWAKTHSRDLRYASQYITRTGALHRPDRWFTVMRSIEDGERELIWSAFGPTEELYDLRDDPEQRVNERGEQGQAADELRSRLEGEVSGWASREQTVLAPETEQLLKQLGYLQ